MIRSAVLAAALSVALAPSLLLAAKAEIAPRIYGGKDVPEGNAPWVAGLMEDGAGPFCTGSLIAPYWVMTAAHCLVREQDDNGNITATINVADLSVFVDQEDISGGIDTLVAADAFYVHPDYDERQTLINDIALILLEQPVADVVPMSLTSTSAYTDMVNRSASENDELELLGWGEIDPDHPDYQSSYPFSDQLQQVRVDYRSFSRCKDFWGPLVDEDAMLCADEPDRGDIEPDDAGDVAPEDNFGEDTCSGDSGGPVLLRYEDAPFLAGLTSFGSSFGCGARDPDTGRVIPAVYTRVVNYLEWTEDRSRNAGEPLVDISVASATRTNSVATADAGVADLTWRNNSIGNDSSNPQLLLTPDSAQVTLSSTGDFSCAPGPDPGSLLCSYLGTLSPGATLTQAVNARWFGVTDTRAGFTARIDQDQGDYRVFDNSAQADFLFTDKTDLAITLPATANGINKTTVDALIENLSDHQDATDVQVALLPVDDAVIESVSVDGVAVTCTGSMPVSCQLPDIAAGAAITAAVNITGSGSASVEATVSAAEGDVAPGNDSATVELNLSFTNLVGSGGSSSGGQGAWLVLLALLAYRRRKN